MRRKNIYIKTFGCTFNRADSLIMKEVLSKNYNIVEDFDFSDSKIKLDYAIINSCAVKNSAEAKMFAEIEKLKKILPVSKIILAGCVPQSELNKNRLNKFNLLGVEQVGNVDKFLLNLENNPDEIIEFLDRSDNDFLDYSKSYNSVIEIVPISKGCLGNCSYCKTKLARGNLVSFSKDRIARAVKRAVESGKKEIWLTSQDCGVYGFDIGESLHSLLKEILNKVEGNYKIRVGMSNPNGILNQIDDLLVLFKDERLFNFLHIPIQSASNKILKLMKRKYVIEDVILIINKIRKYFKDFTIATDFIIGFPGEDEKDFNDSLKFIKKFNIPIVNYSRFWPRPGTVAEKMKLLDVSEVKKRVSIFKEMHEKITLDYYKNFLGEKINFLVDEFENNQLIARTDDYKKVVIKDLKKFKLGDSGSSVVRNSGNWELFI